MPYPSLNLFILKAQTPKLENLHPTLTRHTSCLVELKVPALLLVVDLWGDVVQLLRAQGDSGASDSGYSMCSSGLML